jgi:glycosyltransferase involved in cell wall biosynthesis
LNILHFSTADYEGGSARSAHRIHSGLRRLGHVSHMLVGTKTTSESEVDTVYGSERGRLADRLCEEVTRRVGLQYVYYSSGGRVLRHPWLADADIVQLYNIHGAYFSPRLIPKLARRAPIVWRLSDMWSVTGHCAYAGSCERWRTGCGGCPDLAAYPPIPFDTTAFLWRMKRALYARARLTVVAPSSWSESIARESPLFHGCAVHRIPNGLDLEAFRPIPTEAACAALGLAPGPVSILFSAQVVDANPRKGSDILIDALNRLGARRELRVLLAGHGGEAWSGRVPQDVVPLGYLSGTERVAAANAAADIVVVPSRVENLPNTVTEAMACGRPVAAFDSGGMRDAVIDGETGLLVPSGDAAALAAALARLVDDPALRRRLGEGALILARREFDADTEARRFESLYEDVLRGQAA